VTTRLPPKHPDWFETEWLPAYAPELNPAEMLWNHTKYADLANFIPEDVNDLHQSVVFPSGTHARRHICSTRSSNMPNWSYKYAFYFTKLNKL